MASGGTMNHILDEAWIPIGKGNCGGSFLGILRLAQSVLSNAFARNAGVMQTPAISKIQIGFTFLVPAHLGSPG